MKVPEVVIRPSRREEADQISALALRSKGHWGYSEEFLEACRDELTYSGDDCVSGDVYVAERGGELVGFFELAGPRDAAELAALFVDPTDIGTGLGGQLLDRALGLARERGYPAVSLDADPGAEGFYAHHGARRVGEVASGSVPGRVLPQMRFVLSGRSPL